MATKPKSVKYRIHKRFVVWAEIEISAPDFNNAVDQMKLMQFEDMFESHDTVLVNDVEELRGSGVTEDW